MKEITLTLLRKLASARRVYYHGGCPDGIIAREFLKQYLGNENVHLEYIPISPSQKLEVTEHSAFIDVTPLPEQFEDFLRAGAIIMDHHNSMKPLFEQFEATYPNQLLFGETAEGESGAWLAYSVVMETYSHVPSYPPSKETADHWALVARMIAVGDCWIKEDPMFEKARYLGQHVALIGNDYESGIPTPEFIQHAIQFGELKSKEVKRLADHVMFRDICGIRVGFTNQTKDISDLSEILRSHYGANLVVGWQQQRKKMDNLPMEVTTFSFRSDECIDVGAFAKFLSSRGGGHARAAGAMIPSLQSGITFISDKLQEYYLTR